MKDTDVTEDRVRVLRLIEYEGPRAAVERQVENSIHGTRTFHTSWGKRTPVDQPLGAIRITAVTLGQYPEVIEQAREIIDPSLIQELRDRAQWHQERMEKTEAQALEMAEMVRGLRAENGRLRQANNDLEQDRDARLNGPR